MAILFSLHDRCICAATTAPEWLAVAAHFNDGNADLLRDGCPDIRVLSLGLDADYQEYGAPTALLSRLARSFHQPDTGYTPADPLAARSAAGPDPYVGVNGASVSGLLTEVPFGRILPVNGRLAKAASGRAFHASCHPRIRFAVRRVPRRNYNVSRKAVSAARSSSDKSSPN